MKLTIIPADSVVGVDRVFRTVDMTGIDPAIHAVQFDTLTNKGEIEFLDRARSNELITSIAAFQFLRDRWTAAAPLPPPPPPPPTQAELDARARLQAIRDDALRQELKTQLDTGTNEQISAFVDAQVTTLSSARTMFKRILLLLAAR